MTNKLKYFIGNWKMFGDFSSYKVINKINKYVYKTKNFNKKKVVFCVPGTLIHFFKKKIKSNTISLGAQNCHQSESFGAFTGSLNASMLKKAGAEYIILGHSENRLEGESNRLIKEKIFSALKQKLTVIFCIGETYTEKKKGLTFSVLRKQIKQTLDKKMNFNKIILAYEPVWSIGTNKVPKTNDLKKIIIYIKKNFSENFKKSKNPKVLYGGSVNFANVQVFSSIYDIDGFLIGAASRSSKKFIDIIKNYYK